MFGTYFNNETTKRYIAMFGLVFNKLEIKNPNGSLEKVPLAFGPRDKYIDRIKNADLEEGERIAIKLPRLSYNLTNRQFDANRKLNKHEKRRITVTSNTSTFMYSPTPYSFTFELILYTKNLDDMLQVTDQILPFFEPNLKFTVKPLAASDCDAVIGLNLDSVTSEDNYADGENTNRSVITTFTFTLVGDLYKPINNGSIIKKTTVNLDFDGTQIVMSCEINPFTATEDDVYTITKTIIDGD